MASSENTGLFGTETEFRLYSQGHSRQNKKGREPGIKNRVNKGKSKLLSYRIQENCWCLIATTQEIGV